MSKYRSQPGIQRNADDQIEEEHWLKQFEKSLEKGAVQTRSPDSIFEQINSIMNGTKSKYTSVEAAVEDMKERSGLTSYLNKLNKKAADENDAFTKSVSLIPIVIKKHPQIKNTLQNYITDTRGNLPIPAIIEKIKSIHQSDVSDAKDWDDDNLIKLVSTMNLKAKTDNPNSYIPESNLGTRDDLNDSDGDPSNNDAFFGLKPVKF